MITVHYKRIAELERQLIEKDAEIRKWKDEVIKWQDSDSDKDAEIERLNDLDTFIDQLKHWRKTMLEKDDEKVDNI